MPDDTPSHDADPRRVRFQPGTVVATLGAMSVATTHEIRLLLDRHVRGDWGDLCPEDRRANEDALRHGQRLLSSYRLESGEKLWVITAGDRSETTVLTPGEY